MYMNRTQHLPRPSAQEQQPECRRPMEEELGPLLNLKVHRKYLKKKPGRGRASLVGFEFEFDPEKVPGGAPAPRVELSGSVVTDEARKSLRDVSKSAATPRVVSTTPRVKVTSGRKYH